VSTSAKTASRTAQPAGADPFRLAWGLLTNVKFALFIVGLAGVAGIIGVVIPQTPGQMRNNPAARAVWLEAQRGDFGVLTHPMDRLDLFDVFHSWWFTGLWAVIIVAVTVCTVSRFRPTWRTVHRPPKTVADRYFVSARHHADFAHAGGAPAVEALLRKHRYHVDRTTQTEEATFLFAERYPWSQYGTFLSHLALLMLLVGGLLTHFGGFDRTLVFAETTPAAPVFNQAGPHQIFIRMVDAVRGRDDSGNVVDFRSRLEVRRGDRVVDCTTTVNDPCSAFGYKVHQAAFFDDLGRLKITAPDSRLLYDSVLDFENQTTAIPLLRVTDSSGTVVFDEELPQMATDPGPTSRPEDDYAVAEIALPVATAPGITEGASLPVAWRVIGNELHVAIAGDDGSKADLVPGQAITSNGYRIEFRAARSIPAMRVADMPGANPPGQPVMVQMPLDREGRPYLWVSGIDMDNVMLEQDAPTRTPAGFTYTFGGRVEASGVSVRRDPGGTFIWIAVAMAMVGLGITFYVPRRRLWVKVTPTRTYLAGIAERQARFGRDLRRMGAELGAGDALLPEDLERG